MMKPCLLCLWSFIVTYTDRIPDGILNINIFKFCIGASIGEVKLKFSFRMKILRYPPNITDGFSSYW